MLKLDRKKWLTVLILLVGLTWVWLSRVPPGYITANKPEQPRQGFSAPRFALATTRGDVIALEDLRGKAVIINLWTSWCPPCRAEMPALQNVYELFEEDGLEILAVNSTIQDTPDAAQAFAEEYGLSFPILLDMDGAVSELYQLKSLPTTYFVDQQGDIREVVLGGPMAEALLLVRVQQLLGVQP